MVKRKVSDIIIYVFRFFILKGWERIAYEAGFDYDDVRSRSKFSIIINNNGMYRKLFLWCL